MNEPNDRPPTDLILARWLLPVDRRPIENGGILIDNGTQQILAVGTRAEVESLAPAPANRHDLGDVVLIPGLANAHTHLEFSHLKQPLGRPGIEFTDWIREIVSERKAAAESASAVTKSAAIAAGLHESFSSGVWAIGDIASAPAERRHYQGLDGPHILPFAHVSVFLEQLGHQPDRLADQNVAATAFLDALTTPNDHPLQLHGSLSPHAPYSTSIALTQQLCEQAAVAKTTIAMHLAETVTERELLEGSKPDAKEPTNAFMQLLQDFGVWRADLLQPPPTILGFLKQLRRGSRGLVIHGNYLNDAELDFIASGEDLSIVFCPRTHHYFQHTPYPLAKMLGRGINVAVGTDSRGSNPDLQLVRELSFIKRSCQDVADETILKMGTLAGAKALGIDLDFGSLTVGKRAAISAIVPTSVEERNLPFRWLQNPEPTCHPVIDGQIVIKKR